jgi:hypothetical protein
MKNTPLVSSKKRIPKGLVPLLVIGFLLAVGTLIALRLYKNTAESDAFGWLSITPVAPGASVGLLACLLVILIADALWVIYFILWLVRKKMHLDEPTKTLRL